MRKPSHLSWFLAVLVSMALAFPPGLAAQAQSAGQISRMIPNVNLQHGTRVQLAAAGAKILWGDTITTDSGGRARIALDDGSILNVGSNSSMHVVQHDAANQRTQVQLAYGRLRASAVRLAKAGSSFEVRTPTAVAGVVGTDFTITFDNGISSLSVTEGSVNFCTLQGQCVTVGAGFTSVIRGNQAPTQPTPTAPSAATENVQSTSVGGGGAGAGGGAAAAGAGAAAAGHVSVLAAVIGAIGAVGGIAGVSASNSGKKCGCTTVLPGGTRHP
jgi:ferric-dicitrate binding protein FerR (iron transport regulator)